MEYLVFSLILATMNIRKSQYTEEFRRIIQKLKETRVEAGLTQQEVAKQLGVGQSFISKIESGQYRLDILQLQAFAELYKKRLSYFLNEK